MKSEYISRTLLAIACVALAGLGGCISIKKDEPASTTTTTHTVAAPVVGGTTVERTTTSY